MFYNEPLRMFVLCYGWMGLYLRPVVLHHSLFNLLHNVCIMLMYTYMQLQYCHEKSRVILSHKKPLTGMAINAEYLLFPCTYIFNMCYFLLKGHQIMKLINSSCFKVASVKKIKVRALFDNVSFIYPFLKVLHRFKFQPLTLFNVFSNVQTFVFFYVVHIIPIIIWRVVQYYKLATYQTLVQTEKHLTKKKFDTVLKKIKHLSDVNGQIDSLMSPVLLSLFINYSFNIVSTCCVIMSGYATIFSFSYISFLVANLLYIIWLCNQCCQCLNCISEHFRKVQSSNHTKSHAFLRHIDIYKHYFRFQFFSFFAFDEHFFISTFALLVNTTVMLVQTQTQ